jgi:hypothetical protein
MDPKWIPKWIKHGSKSQAMIAMAGDRSNVLALAELFWRIILQ